MAQRVEANDAFDKLVSYTPIDLIASEDSTVESSMIKEYSEMIAALLNNGISDPESKGVLQVQALIEIWKKSNTKQLAT